MSLIVPSDMLATAATVGSLLAQTVADLGDVDDASLAQACDMANGVVVSYLGLTSADDLDDMTDVDVSVATTVATRVAARIFRNPRDLSSFNYNEVSQTYSDPRLLTPDERMMLDSSKTLGFA